jgi:toxin ParE1/3/4
MNILWRQDAEDDLNAAFDYILERDVEAALRLYQTIRSAVERLADHPQLGRAGRVADTRELVVSGTSYLVAYLIDVRLDAVIILRVLHGAQRWPDQL